MGYGLQAAAVAVSILAQPGGRALRDRLGNGAIDWDVSILAQPGGRALRGPWVLEIKSSMFQSSPSPGAGRCGVCARRDFLCRTVSILAQPGGRALQSWEG